MSSTIEIEAPTFNILTQSPPTNKNASLAFDKAKLKLAIIQFKKKKKRESKKIASPPNQKEQKRKGKMVEPPPNSDSDFVSEGNLNMSSYCGPLDDMYCM
ncbi:hypothetical protein H5410_034198 [Solanum commersonii]|uniref:Uncharacterized protein n=1 Tax=Solanum commersonii TaxID=4109 RepID=A0A9J5YUV1_SOLCO|nr:hypothetical protein H5410_034198 [Solanum commersonii]